MGKYEDAKLWDDYQHDDPGTFRAKYQAGEYDRASETIKDVIRWDHRQNTPGNSDPFVGSGRPGENYSTEDGTACW